MKLLFLYTSHVFLAILVGQQLCIKTQVSGNTNFHCGNDSQLGLFRIVRGSATNQLDGEVQVCDNDGGRRWYSVCGDGSWNDTTAANVCQQLGFSETGAIATSMERTTSGSILHCSQFGLERTATDCVTVVEPSCVTQAMVHCEPSQCRDGEIRLRGRGSTEQIGRVEICIDQQWGTINNRFWGFDDANIVCGQIGFSNRDASNDNNALRFGEGTGPTYFREFLCTGADERLLDCRHLNDTENDHGEDAGVRCRLALCNDGEIRLVDGRLLVDSGQQLGGSLQLERRPLNGRVEICIAGRWGSVCDNHWDAVDASVVCNQLGFPREGAIAVHQSAFGEPVIDPILLNDVQCEGTETSLTECTSRSGRHGCSHSETAGVICKVCTNGDVRLVNGSNEQEGRVEVCFLQQWSSICDDSWSEADATVTCRQLGYSDTNAVNKSAYADFQIGEGIIYLRSLECIGTEARLLECDIGTVISCNHSMDVGVTCFNKQVSSTKEPPSSQSTLVTILGAVIGVLVVLLILSTVTAICTLVVYRCHHKGGTIIEEVYDTIPDGPYLNREAVTDSHKIELQRNAAYRRPPVTGGTDLYRQSDSAGCVRQMSDPDYEQETTVEEVYDTIPDRPDLNREAVTDSQTTEKIELETNAAYGRPAVGTDIRKTGGRVSQISEPDYEDV